MKNLPPSSLRKTKPVRTIFLIWDGLSLLPVMKDFRAFWVSWSKCESIVPTMTKLKVSLTSSSFVFDDNSEGFLKTRMKNGLKPRVLRSSSTSLRLTSGTALLTYSRTDVPSSRESLRRGTLHTFPPNASITFFSPSFPSHAPICCSSMKLAPLSRNSLRRLTKPSISGRASCTLSLRRTTLPPPWAGMIKLLSGFQFLSQPGRVPVAV
jgi:hypothetical protein